MKPTIKEATRSKNIDSSLRFLDQGAEVDNNRPSVSFGDRAGQRGMSPVTQADSVKQLSILLPLNLRAGEVRGQGGKALAYRAVSFPPGTVALDAIIAVGPFPLFDGSIIVGERVL
jgi:hypothetical protein